VKQHAKATFKDTCEEEILALIGVLLLSGVNKDNHAATEEMFKPTRGIPAYRSGFSERRFVFVCAVLVWMIVQPGTNGK